MSRRSIGSVIAAIGVVLAALAALADQIGIGDESKFGWQQTGGVIIGVLIVVAGLVIARWGARSGDDIAKR